MTTAMEIVNESRTWLGVRWLHQGRSRAGVDCIGLVIQVAHALALTDFDTRDYGRYATDETMLDLCRTHLQSVAANATAPGDIAVFAFDRQRHIGIIGDYPAAGELSLIHAHAVNRHVVEHRLDAVWQRRIIGRFRFPGVM